mmetsp:Transcript_19283/g.30173  ORF Transcript_19283/g.30173 Transcript_19283/m.30173 type:complete len:241 (-) Transcript_19283:287-1009(-)
MQFKSLYPLPFECMAYPKIPNPSSLPLSPSFSSDRASTIAPAPSPNKIHELRSSQSTHLVNASAPNTKAFCDAPFVRNCDAVTTPNKNPEHAAVKSNATHFPGSIPIAEAMDGASPNKSSGEEVAQMTRSISDADLPDISSAFFAASIPNVRSVSGVVVSVTPSRSRMGRVPSWMRTRRCSMPVRVRIHSSLVSWTDSISLLVMIVDGAQDPTPMGRTDSLPPLACRAVVVVIWCCGVWW